MPSFDLPAPHGLDPLAAPALLGVLRAGLLDDDAAFDRSSERLSMVVRQDPRGMLLAAMWLLNLASWQLARQLGADVPAELLLGLRDTRAGSCCTGCNHTEGALVTGAVDMHGGAQPSTLLLLMGDGDDAAGSALNLLADLVVALADTGSTTDLDAFRRIERDALLLASQNAL